MIELRLHKAAFVCALEYDQTANSLGECKICGWPIGNHKMANPHPKGPFEPDPVNHPQHYTSHPSGVECIEITEHFNFNIGNAIKYLWRAGLKGNQLQDLQKAEWYVKREIQRLQRRAEKGEPPSTM
jgi:Protein of unknwon function (DUF3310)